MNKTGSSKSFKGPKKLAWMSSLESAKLIDYIQSRLNSFSDIIAENLLIEYATYRKTPSVETLPISAVYEIILYY